MRHALRVAIAAALCLSLDPAFAKSGQAPRQTRVERSQAAQPAPQGFDGGWTIETATTVGNCAPLIPSAIAIQDRKVVEAAGGGTAAWGYVENDGVIVARFTGQDGRTARANGQLRGDAGSGAWSSNTDLCGGAWRAYRTGAQRAAQ